MKSCRCFSSCPDSLKGEEEKGGGKAAGLSVNSAWHWEPVAPFLLVLLPALVTPMVLLSAQCCMELALWVSPWTAVADLASQDATGQGTAGFIQRVGIPAVYHV